MTAPSPTSSGAHPATQVSEEEEARQAIDMLRGDDVSARVAAASKLGSVSTVLGEERTRSELLPFLADGCIDDEDEVLLALATSLGGMVDQVGGGEHAHSLLPPLELLLAVGTFAPRVVDARSALRTHAFDLCSGRVRV